MKLNKLLAAALVSVGLSGCSESSMGQREICIGQAETRAILSVRDCLKGVNNKLVFNGVRIAGLSAHNLSVAERKQVQECADGESVDEGKPGYDDGVKCAANFQAALGDDPIHGEPTVGASVSCAFTNYSDLCKGADAQAD